MTENSIIYINYRLSKNILPPFYFFNNFHKFSYFFTKFGIQVAKRFLHMCGKFHDYSTSIGGVISISKKFLKFQVTGIDNVTYWVSDGEINNVVIANTYYSTTLSSNKMGPQRTQRVSHKNGWPRTPLISSRRMNGHQIHQTSIRLTFVCGD